MSTAPSAADPLIEHFRAMARYNRGANERLYDACARLEDSQRKRPLGAFFGSIHGTLNHILLGDRIWMARFEGRAAPSTRLNRELHAKFDDLRAARRAEDQRIETFFATLADIPAGATLTYGNNQGRRMTDPLPVLYAHFFNHQTHHRGQAHGLLTRLGVEDAPVLDLHRVLNP